MKSQEKRDEKRTPEDIAKDLENVVFPEVDEEDLKEIFGGLSEESTQDCGSNVNCGC